MLFRSDASGRGAGAGWCCSGGRATAGRGGGGGGGCAAASGPTLMLLMLAVSALLLLVQLALHAHIDDAVHGLRSLDIRRRTHSPY